MQVKIAEVIKKYNAYLPYALFLFFGILMRIPYYTHYFVPCISVDSLAYSDFTKSVLVNQPPLFKAYTPGYPVFICLLNAIGVTSFKSFLLIQTILNFFICLAAIFVLFRTKALSDVFKYAVLILFIIFFNSSATLSNETTIGPIQFYTSLSFLLALLSVKIIHDKQVSFFYIGLSSLAFCLMLLLRPQAIILAPLVMLTLVSLIFYKQLRHAVFFALMPVLLMLCICSYNYVFENKFTYTAQNFLQKVRCSAIFVQSKSHQPVVVQQAFAAADGMLQHKYPGQTKDEIVRADPSISDVYADFFMSEVRASYKGVIPAGMIDSIRLIMQRDRNLQSYFKKVVTALMSQLRDNSLQREFYLSELKERVLYINRTGYFEDSSDSLTKKIATMDYYRYYYGGDQLQLKSGDTKKVVIRSAFFINAKMSSAIKLLPVGYIHILTLILFCLIACIRLTRVLSIPVILTGVLILLIPVGNYMLIALFVYPGTKYSYTSDLFCLISPLILFQLIYDMRKDMQSKNSGSSLNKL